MSLSSNKSKSILLICILFLSIIGSLNLLFLVSYNYDSKSQNLLNQSNYEYKNLNHKSTNSSVNPEENINFESQSFIINNGQLRDESIYYYQNSKNSSIGFGKSTIFMRQKLKHLNGSENIYYNITFSNSNNIKPQSIGIKDGKINYFKGSNKVTNINRVNEIIYYNLYNNINLRYYFSEDGLKYEFIILPGGNPSDIKIKLSNNVKSIVKSDLVIYKTINELDQVIIKDTNLKVFEKASKNLIPAIFKKLNNHNTYSFQLQDYNKSNTIIIDPLLLGFSTYLGGSNYEEGGGIVTDDSGNFYVSGYTGSSDFPTLNAYQENLQGSEDFILTKLNSTGNGLIYSTYVGGSSADFAYSLALDNENNPHLFGYTRSSDFPTVNPYQTNIDTDSSSEFDAVLIKLNSSGNGIIFSTYLGGENDDYGIDLRIDPENNIILSGYTLSSNFPTHNSYQQNNNGNIDMFLTKITSSGDELIFSTYFGGTGDDWGRRLAFDTQQNIYLIGYTSSLNFPTKNEVQNNTETDNSSSKDITLTKFNSTGNGLVYSTYLGGNFDDYGLDVRIDDLNNAYVAGYTESSDYPTFNHFQDNSQTDGCSGTVECRDIVVTKINSTGNGINYSTYIGGNERDLAFGIELDSSKNVYVTGTTGSTDYPTINAFQNNTDTDNSNEKDVIISILNSTGNGMIISTYFGGNGNEDGNNILIANDGYTIFFVGRTTSTNYPTLQEYQNNSDTDNSNTKDMFLSKILKDMDNDQMADIWELESGLNITKDDSSLDKDMDGLSNLLEYQLGTTANNTDTEFDGMDDYYEYTNNLDPLNDDTDLDKDMDGLNNLLEYQLGTTANNTDTDFDGMDDYYEYTNNLDPLNDDTVLDKDSDGLNNLLEYQLGTAANSSDTESDGMDDYYEYTNNLDPQNDDSSSDKDSDGLDNLLEYQLGTTANNTDTESDGMDDGYEYFNGLDLFKDDSSFDNDTDGLNNLLEYQLGTSANNTDSESDGMDDYYEYINNLDPLNDDSLSDKDMDGLNNLLEYQLGTSANNTDSESDGMDDGYEYFNGLDFFNDDSSLDNDSDGLNNLLEYQLGTTANNTDTDFDGIDDYYEYTNNLDPLNDDTDLDKDSDGLDNLLEYQLGTFANNTDTESDDMDDYYEYTNNLDPLNDDSSLDKDSDGLDNLLEYQLGTTANNTDTESDGMDDYYEYTNNLDPLNDDTDLDKDSDGLNNLLEYQLGTSANNTDTDFDGMDDYYEYTNNLDPLNDDSSLDNDTDGLDNLLEYQLGTSANNTDTDFDGMDDYYEYTNNLDPLNDDSSSDKDMDGLNNLLEYQLGTSAYNTDTDFDGMDDGYEYFNGLDLFSDDSSLDMDTDGLNNLQEYQLGTSANNSDTDSDGMDDGWEVSNNLNPLVNDSNEDPDEDGLSNIEEFRNNTDPKNSDTDNDGELDGYEVDNGTNPNDPSSNVKTRNMYILVFTIFVLLVVIYFAIKAFLRKKNEQAEELGFDSYREMRYAQKRGFQNSNDYYIAHASGFNTKYIQKLSADYGFQSAKEIINEGKQFIKKVETMIDELDEKNMYKQIESLKTPDELINFEMKYQKTLNENDNVSNRVILYLDFLKSIFKHNNNENLLVNFSNEDLHQIHNKLDNLISEMYEIYQNLSQRITKKKKWFDPWDDIIDLIHKFKSEVQINISRIAELINVKQNHAESILKLILKQNPNIGKYLELEQIFIKKSNDNFNDLKESRSVINKSELLQICSECKESQSTLIRTCTNCSNSLPYCQVCKRGFTKIDQKLNCIHCNHLYHKSHLIAYIQSHGKCAVCKEKLTLGNYDR